MKFLAPIILVALALQGCWAASLHAPLREEENISNKPYKYGYAVDDGENNKHYYKEEADLDGSKKGQYGYANAEGLYRHVSYIADKQGYRTYVLTNEPGAAPQDPSDGIMEVKPVPENIKMEMKERDDDKKQQQGSYKSQGYYMSQAAASSIQSDIPESNQQQQNSQNSGDEKRQQIQNPVDSQAEQYYEELISSSNVRDERNQWQSPVPMMEPQIQHRQKNQQNDYQIPEAREEPMNQSPNGAEQKNEPIKYYNSQPKAQDQPRPRDAPEQKNEPARYYNPQPKVQEQPKPRDAPEQKNEPVRYYNPQPKAQDQPRPRDAPEQKNEPARYYNPQPKVQEQPRPRDVPEQKNEQIVYYSPQPEMNDKVSEQREEAVNSYISQSKMQYRSKWYAVYENVDDAKMLNEPQPNEQVDIKSNIAPEQKDEPIRSYHPQPMAQDQPKPYNAPQQKDEPIMSYYPQPMAQDQPKPYNAPQQKDEPIRSYYPQPMEQDQPKPSNAPEQKDEPIRSYYPQPMIQDQPKSSNAPEQKDEPAKTIYKYDSEDTVQSMPKSSGAAKISDEPINSSGSLSNVQAHPKGNYVPVLMEQQPIRYYEPKSKVEYYKSVHNSPKMMDSHPSIMQNQPKNYNYLLNSNTPANSYSSQPMMQNHQTISNHQILLQSPVGSIAPMPKPMPLRPIMQDSINAMVSAYGDQPLIHHYPSNQEISWSPINQQQNVQYPQLSNEYKTALASSYAMAQLARMRQPVNNAYINAAY